MTDLEQAIEAVECGLLPVTKNPDRPVRRRELRGLISHSAWMSVRS